MHYLLVDDEDRFAAARRFVDTLEEVPASEVSIDEILGVDAAALETAVAAYLAETPIPHREMPVPPGATTAARLTPLAPERTLFHLGDLLIHSNPDRLEDARARFEAALAIDPSFAPAIAGLGLVSEVGGDLRAAESDYERALTQLPDAFRLQVLFGEIELSILGKRRPQSAEEEQRLDQAIAAFQRAVELRPGYGEGWALLGYAYNLQAQSPEDAVATLERAYEMLPGRGDVAYNLLLAYARAGKRQEAIELVATAEARGASEVQLAPARQTLLQLDLQHAVTLAREKKLDEAVALLEKVQAEATDPALQQQAAGILAQIKP